MKPLLRLTGRVAVLDRADVDTDQIMPKQFLKRVERSGYGEFLFFDWAKDPGFELNRPEYQGAEILITGRNFGCGSSREHAPQALARAGFRAFVGESFAEIFFGNCVALGLPAVTLPRTELVRLMESVELDPRQELVLDLARGTLASRAGTQSVTLPDGARRQLLEGSYDATAVLLEAGDAIEATAERLPYVGGFAR